MPELMSRQTKDRDVTSLNPIIIGDEKLHDDWEAFELGELSYRQLALRHGWVERRNRLQRFLDYLVAGLLSYDD